MASLLGILSTGGTNLNTAQGQLSIANNNVSNVNTPGYSKETAEVVSNPGSAPWDPNGVQISTVTQARDRFLEAQLPASLGQSSFSQARSDGLGSVTALDPSSTSGISTALSAFYASLSALSQNAGDPGLRTAVISAAQTLTTAFNQASQQITAARSGLDTQAQGSLTEVNTDAKQVAALNQQIRTATASGTDVNSLLDARQQLQDKLAQLTGVTPVTDAQGDVSLALPGGQLLVSGDFAGSLSALPDPTNQGHLALQLTSADGKGTATLAGSAIGGTIGGELNVRDGALLSTGNSIDQLASDFGNAVNAASENGYALDGTSGHDLFTVGAQLGAAGRIAVSSDVAADPSLLAAAGSATGGAGDATNLLAIQATQDQALSTGATAGTAFGNIVSSFGSAAASATAQAQQDAAINTHLTTLRESVSGVSVDEEMINMQKAQRAYEAISHVMSTTTTMLDTLMAFVSTV
jgi:flagellar hook-associated protein 1